MMEGLTPEEVLEVIKRAIEEARDSGFEVNRMKGGIVFDTNPICRVREDTGQRYVSVDVVELEMTDHGVRIVLK